MKKCLLFTLLSLLFVYFLSSFQLKENQQSLQGAWISKNGSLETVLLFMDGYFTQSIYDKKNKMFIETRGGPFQLSDNKITIQYEFDSKDSTRVNQNEISSFVLNENALSINSKIIGGIFARVDDGMSSLAGLWKITARKGENGNMMPIHQRGTRKTIKILSSTRFQWAAIDPGAKAFLGSGGGTYMFRNGKYTEQIEFFSRDSSRVGASLSFDGELEEGNWHHSGLSSRGEPLYEVWSRQQK